MQSPAISFEDSMLADPFEDRHPSWIDAVSRAMDIANAATIGAARVFLGTEKCMLRCKVDIGS